MVTGDPGTVDQDIDLAQRFIAFVCRGGDLVMIANIDRDGVGVAQLLAGFIKQASLTSHSETLPPSSRIRFAQANPGRKRRR